MTVAQDSQPTPFGSFAREGWDTDARRAAQDSQKDETPQPEARPEAGRRSGRRAQSPAPAAEPLNAEPLNYITQSRPQVPSYDGPSFRSRSISAVPDRQEQTDEPQSPAPYRLRDFSPEGRRSATISGSTAPSASSGELDYHTQNVAPVAPVEITSVETSSAEAKPEHLLTRRELRALEQQRSGGAQQFDAPSHHSSTVTEPIRPRNREHVAPADETPVSTVEEPSRFPLFVAPNEQTVEPQPVEPEVATSEPRQEPARVAERETEAETVEPADKAEAAFDALLFQQPVLDEQAPIDAEPVSAPEDLEQKPFGLSLNTPETPSAYTPPVGHWSTQASIDDDEQVQENTFSRNVAASGALPTSALVLPSIPTMDDLLSPLSSTGEILVTGSINLPSSLGTTGALPAHYDHSDVDALLAEGDREDESDPDSAPVRAIRAVSTHTSTGPMIATVKPKGNSRLPMVLAVSAAVMAVGVVVLFVAGMIFKVF
ncbi:MAG TPA: hypothetical protein VGC18_00985 [Lacisediminihabitans sp.]|uniref:hypothetical protein n=1 Tax=Lacisediminihabitans sp. TaxID=2787631 RepID=UPI002ED8CB76